MYPIAPIATYIHAYFPDLPKPITTSIMKTRQNSKQKAMSPWMYCP